MLLATALASCAYDVRYEDCAISCSTDTGCPSDLWCGAEGKCRTPGATETCGTAGASPSCAGLGKTCGANADDDCCSTADPIPGGTYYRSYDVAADGMYPSTSFPATVSPFLLDKYEVTVGRFRKFVEAGGGVLANPPPAGASARSLNGAAGQGGWEASWNENLPADKPALIAALKCDATFQSWTDAPGPNEELPINCLTWYEAFAFCAWDGGFLPTEAEWNFAATGGSEQRAYPWSNPPSATTIDCTRANYSSCSGAPVPVGSTSPQGDGRWRQADLAGNVWEWTLDWYSDVYSNPCDNCADTNPTAKRANRGGSFGFVSTYLRSGLRGFELPLPQHASIGVRCAR